MKRDNHMAIYALLIVIVLLCVFTWHPAKAYAQVWEPMRNDSAPMLRIETPRYYDEQLLNYRMTEFCAVVKKPPKALTDALEEWLKLDAKAALPAVLWFNLIAEEYQRAKCGDV